MFFDIVEAAREEPTEFHELLQIPGVVVAQPGASGASGAGTLVAASLWARGHHVAGRPAPGGQEGEECGGGGDGGDGGGGGAPAAAGRPAGKVLRGMRQMPGGAAVGVLPVVRTHVLRPDGWKLERQV